ncbi:MAG: alanine:cation symporter family protein, partial [Phycisphaerales bacterium]|nr:alanine:cation symporter family protein [Phycisphaerales bacterium]
IDTLIVCTMTALVITISGIYADSDFIARAAENSDLKGVIVTAEAFNQSIPGFGKFLVTAAVSLFAFSTMISWSYYGEQGAFYLFGEAIVMPYRIMFVVALFLGAIWKFGPVLNVSDILFAFMALPTLLATIMLSRRVVDDLKAYHAKYMA